MKKYNKITALLLSIVLIFSCISAVAVQASAEASILSVTLVQYPTKLKYYQGTDWAYGYYDFPEGCTYGTFKTTGDKLTFTYSKKTYNKISFLYSNGYFTDQYFDRGMLDLRGLKVKVFYSDGTEKIVEFKETRSENWIHQNIYANPSLGEFFVGSNKINVYIPGNTKIKASFYIDIIEKGSYETGDVNMDSKINSSDALLVLQSVVNLKTLTAEQKTLADVNKDYRVNSSDALEILKITVGA